MFELFRKKNPKMSLPNYPTTQHNALVFVNYARDDHNTHFNWLIDELNKTEVGSRIWYDIENIQPGSEGWKQQIDTGLRRTAVMLSLLSRNSVAAERHWIRYEQDEALRLLTPIIPLIFEDVAVPEHLALFQAIDFRSNREQAIIRLQAALAQLTLRYGRQLINLSPAGRAQFVGRETELHELANKILRRNATMVSTMQAPLAIQGMGGQGKSLLAEELVRRLSSSYPGGVIVERRGENPEPYQAVLNRWVSYVEGKLPSEDKNPTYVQGLLTRSAGALLVYFDDVVERDIDDVLFLLDALPNDSSRIVTTRERPIAEALGCELYALPTMGEADAFRLLRSRLPKTNIEMVTDTLLRDLYETVAGHPLSMVLAAGRVSHNGDLSDINQDLKDDLLALARSTAGRVAPETNVRLNVRKSYVALEVAAQNNNNAEWARCLRALAIFPDSYRFDVSLVAAVFGDQSERSKPTRDALQALSDRAMVERDGDGKEGHYYLHPVIRAYAREQLEQARNETNIVWRHYMDFIIEKCKTIMEIASQERSNPPYQLYLRHARTMWLELSKKPSKKIDATTWSGAELSRIIDIFNALGKWYSDTASFSEALSCHEIALSILNFTTDANDSATELRRNDQEGIAFSGIGEIYRRKGEIRKGIEYAKQALGIFEKSDNLARQANTLNDIGHAYWGVQEHDEAIPLHQRALDLFIQLGDQDGEGDTLNRIGSVYFQTDRLEEGLSMFDQAAARHHAAGNRHDEGEDWNDKGACLLYLHRYSEAIQCVQVALSFLRDVGNRRLEAVALNNLAASYIGLGQDAEAGKFAQDAFDMNESLQLPHRWEMNNLGLVAQMRGAFDDARSKFESAVNTGTQKEDWRTVVGAQGHLAWLYFKHLGQPQKGLDLAEQALQLMREKKLRQSHGGRRPTDFETMITEMRQSLKN